MQSYSKKVLCGLGVQEELSCSSALWKH